MRHLSYAAYRFTFCFFDLIPFLGFLFCMCQFSFFTNSHIFSSYFAIPNYLCITIAYRININKLLHTVSDSC